MKKEDVLRATLSEWRSLPVSEKQTETQLFAFAMKMANDPHYAFQCRGDRYQDIMGYLSHRISGLKKMGM
jgi:hypothetical protein